MKKYLNTDYLNSLWEATKKCAAIIFAIATALVTFVSVDDILNYFNKNSIWTKIAFLVILCLLALIIAIIISQLKKEVILFSKETASVKAKYGNMADFIADNTDGERYTVVIPINNDLNVVGDFKKISMYGKGSMHYFWLSQMKKWLEGKNVRDDAAQQTEIENLVKNNLRGSKPNKQGLCKIGDHSYIRDINNVNYLLIVTAEIKTISGAPKSTYTDKQYFETLQSLIEVIGASCPQSEKVYVPIIGGGYAHKNQSNKELLRIMAEVMIYNSSILKHEITIIIYEKLKHEVPLFTLKTQA